MAVAFIEKPAALGADVLAKLVTLDRQSRKVFRALGVHLGARATLVADALEA